MSMTRKASAEAAAMAEKIQVVISAFLLAPAQILIV